MEFSDAPISNEEGGVREEDSKNSEHGQEERSDKEDQEKLDHDGKWNESGASESQNIGSQKDCPMLE